MPNAWLFRRAEPRKRSVTSPTEDSSLILFFVNLCVLCAFAVNAFLAGTPT